VELSEGFTTCARWFAQDNPHSVLLDSFYLSDLALLAHLTVVALYLAPIVTVLLALVSLHFVTNVSAIRVSLHGQ
jgi:hypothetical protein